MLASQSAQKYDHAGGSVLAAVDDAAAAEARDSDLADGGIVRPIGDDSDAADTATAACVD